jgi:osmotically-inducible protein OsmY
MNTDKQVRQNVIAALQWEPTVDSKQFDVNVENGLVTIRGNVGSYVEKWDAGRATQRVPGVRGLRCELSVLLSEANSRNDADIASAAFNVLQWMSYLPRNCIKVAVDKGWITLSGEVEWEFQRQAVLGTMRFLIGVMGVTETIVVKPFAAVTQTANGVIAQKTTALTLHAASSDFAAFSNVKGAPDIAQSLGDDAVTRQPQFATQDASPA